MGSVSVRRVTSGHHFANPVQVSPIQQRTVAESLAGTFLDSLGTCLKPDACRAAVYELGTFRSCHGTSSQRQDHILVLVQYLAKMQKLLLAEAFLAICRENVSDAAPLTTDNLVIKVYEWHAEAACKNLSDGALATAHESGQ